jgi:hypothetical protein
MEPRRGRPCVCGVEWTKSSSCHPICICPSLYVRQGRPDPLSHTTRRAFPETSLRVISLPSIPQQLMLNASCEALVGVEPRGCAANRSRCLGRPLHVNGARNHPWHRQCRVHLDPRFALHAGAGAASAANRPLACLRFPGGHAVQPHLADEADLFAISDLPHWHLLAGYHPDRWWTIPDCQNHTRDPPRGGAARRGDQLSEPDCRAVICDRGRAAHSDRSCVFARLDHHSDRHGESG